MDQRNSSLIKVNLAVLLFGLAGLFGKFVTLPSLLIVLGRVFFGSISLGILFIFNKQKIRLEKPKDYILLMLCGLILAIHWATFFQSIQISTVAVGLLSFSTFPVFTTFLEPLFFKEKIKNFNVVIALITVLGAILVIPSFDFGNNVTQGALWGILSGFTFALLSILNKKSVEKYSSLVIAFYQDLTATVILIPFLFLIKGDFNLNNILLLILLGVVFTAISHLLFISGMKGIKAQLASIIASLEPVYGIIAAFFFLGETPSIRTIVGGFIILSATLIATLKK